MAIRCWAMSATGMTSSEPRDVGAPGVVSFQVGLFPWQVEPPVRELAQPLPVTLDHQLGRHCLGGWVDKRTGVSDGEEVQARVVGE